MCGSYILGILSLIFISEFGGFPPLEGLALAIFVWQFSVKIRLLDGLHFPCSCALIKPKFWYVVVNIYISLWPTFESDLSCSRVLVEVARLHEPLFFCWTDCVYGLYLFCTCDLNGILMSI